jgi:hypothetical protein
MDEKEYDQPPNPQFFFTVHSAWCPPKKSDLMEVQLKQPELSEPSWKDADGKTVTDSQIGIPVKLSVKCNEDIDQDAVVVFRMYPEGADIKTTQAEATLSGKNVDGTAETEEICWGTNDQYEPPDGPNKFFFTAQTKRSKYITSGVFEIKLPEFSNLTWQKDGKKTETIFVHDSVTITCDTKNIPADKEVIVEIFEPGREGADEHIFDVKGIINENKLEIEWPVEYKEKQGTKSKNELDEKGYTIPEYHFHVRYFGFRSEASPVVEIYGQININIKDKYSTKPMRKQKYTIYYPDGSLQDGTTDENGDIFNDRIYIGEKIIIFDNGEMTN